MNNITTELANALVLGDGITEVFRKHLERAMNELLQAELSAFLDYEKYDREGWGTGNSRNGSYSRNFETEYGNLELIIPRDRNGDFQNQTLNPYARRSDKLETTVIHMFEKGMTVRDIADVIEKMYGHHYSASTISNMTMAVNDLVEAFNNRSLANRYTCIFLDATVIPIRRDTVQKEAVYIALGIREDGTKEVISYTIAPTESSHVWSELLDDIKSRGVEDVLLFVTDGLAGIRERINEKFSSSRYQSCLVHVGRNIFNKVRVNDRQEVADHFKTIYSQPTREAGEKALNDFITRWKPIYPKAVKPLEDNEHLLTFYDFPSKMRKTIYSTNLIEGLNHHLKRYTKRKEQFPNEESLERFLVSRLNEYNHTHLSKCHQGLKQCLNDIKDMFET